MNDIVRATPKASVLAKMAGAYDMEPSVFLSTIKATVMPNGGRDVSNEQVAAFLSVADQYKLNPFTREIYAFPAKGGGIQQIVSIDGWLKLINSHAQFDGMEFTDSFDPNGALISVTCKIYRKDRDHSIEATEYMSECARGTEPWKQWPRRMLRHKAAIQAARYAFSFSGIVDPDEAERQFDRRAEVVPEPTRAETLVKSIDHNPFRTAPEPAPKPDVVIDVDTTTGEVLPADTATADGAE